MFTKREQTNLLNMIIDFDWTNRDGQEAMYA